jgi:hypothetical protein
VLDPIASPPSAVYVATDTGVMVCSPCTGSAADFGATWTPLNAGLPNVKVSALTFSRDQQWLIAWTHGLGAYAMPRSGWDMLGGKLASRPISVTWGPNRLDTFAVGTDNQIWHNWFDGTSWHWDNAAGTVSSDPSAVATAPGTATPGLIDVFARGSDGSVLHAQWSSASGWSPWTSLGGKIIGEPSSSNVGSGQVVVFVQGTDNHLWAWSSTKGWQPSMGGVLAAPPTAVSAGTEYDAFVEGSDRALWYWSSATGWHGAGGVLAAKPTAVSWGSGRLDAFVEGTDTGLWHWTNGSGTASAWEGIGGKLASKPAAVTWGSPRLDAFVQGTDNHLWHAFNSGSGWQWEELLGPQLTIDPSAVSSAVNRLDVFLRSTDSSLWHRSLP